MPLKIRAIIDAIKDTPLCRYSLYTSRERQITYCVMGALLASVGATVKDLKFIADDEDSDSYWDAEGMQKFRKKLTAKFGISCSKDVDKLVGLNDQFLENPNNPGDVSIKRTCHIMTSLAKEYDSAAQG